jgi:hypothetical protein
MEVIQYNRDMNDILIFSIVCYCWPANPYQNLTNFISLLFRGLADSWHFKNLPPFLQSDNQENNIPFLNQFAQSYL